MDAYDRAVAFWYGRINYEVSAPSPADLRLDRIRALLQLLGNPHERFRILHVAGSKGKGSTSAMLAAILRRGGYRVGLFTSPHLVRVEERMQVDGVAISREELTALVEEIRVIEPELSRHYPGLTFFEMATALGFLHFCRRRVQWAVLEVGLGGRFDATNVCRPMVSLITSISLDHTRQLGDRLASIAREKAGIVKPGRPVVSGVRGDEARAVIERTCRERGAPLRQVDTDFRFTSEPGRVTADELQWPTVQVTTRQRTWPALGLGLLGGHQAANAAAAVACVEVLREQGITISDGIVAEALVTVQWPARMEVFGRKPLIVLDCAHNVASAEALVDTLKTSFPPVRRLLVLAVSNDKDVPGIVRVLAQHFARAYVTRFTSNPRGVAADQLAALWTEAGGAEAIACAAPEEAWRAARQAAAADDLICVAGSVFLAGELRPTVCATEERRHA